MFSFCGRVYCAFLTVMVSSRPHLCSTVSHQLVILFYWLCVWSPVISW